MIEACNGEEWAEGVEKTQCLPYANRDKDLYVTGTGGTGNCMAITDAENPD